MQNHAGTAGTREQATYTIVFHNKTCSRIHKLTREPAGTVFSQVCKSLILKMFPLFPLCSRFKFCMRERLKALSDKSFNS